MAWQIHCTGQRTSDFLLLPTYDEKGIAVSERVLPNAASAFVACNSNFVERFRKKMNQCLVPEQPFYLLLLTCESFHNLLLLTAAFSVVWLTQVSPSHCEYMPVHHRMQIFWLDDNDVLAWGHTRSYKAFGKYWKYESSIWSFHNRIADVLLVKYLSTCLLVAYWVTSHSPATLGMLANLFVFNIFYCSRFFPPQNREVKM